MTRARGVEETTPTHQSGSAGAMPVPRSSANRGPLCGGPAATGNVSDCSLPRSARSGVESHRAYRSPGLVVPHWLTAVLGRGRPGSGSEAPLTMAALYALTLP